LSSKARPTKRRSHDERVEQAHERPIAGAEAVVDRDRGGEHGLVVARCDAEPEVQVVVVNP
jgi:hypothetical protein